MKVTVKRKNPNDAIAVVIGTEYIKLESAMKLANIVPTGGSAKMEIQEGYVTVNGEVCTMRGKKLYPGDRFSFQGDTYLITIHAPV
jgi:ribosome-associated protein